MKKILIFATLTLTFTCLFYASATSQEQLIINKKRLFSDKISIQLLSLVEDYNAGKDITAWQKKFPHAIFSDGKVLIEAISNHEDASILLKEIEGANISIKEVSHFERILNGTIDIHNITKLYGLSHLHYVHLCPMPSKKKGTVTSQGDKALRADVARTTFAVDGTGIKVGVLSDSYNALKGAANDIVSGDLPAAGVQVLEDLTGSGWSDEGRAMLQLIHDLAPSADLAFRTAFKGTAHFANGITALRQAGCKVIVDDIGYLAQPFFMDGIIARSVDNNVNNGVTYFSAAGNSGVLSYEGTNEFSSDIFIIDGEEYQLYDFDAGTGTDFFQRVTVPVGGFVQLSFQWDEPFFSATGVGSKSDVDIFLFTSDQVNTINGKKTAMGSIIATAFDDNIRSGDAVEILSDENTHTSSTLYLAFGLYAGTAPTRVKYIVFDGITSINEHNTNSSTSFGHPNAEKAIGIGAAFFGSTPEFGLNPPRLENFSSRGGTPILFNSNGVRITPIIRQKPEITAVDGTNTTFFGSDIASDTDNFPNFFGTSAAAPHAAAVAALMLQRHPTATPTQIKTALQGSAIDILKRQNNTNTGVGFDFDSGFGLIQANGAIQALDQFFTLKLDLKVMLQGAFSTSQMNTNLTANNLVPLQEPYKALGFKKINNTTLETTTTAVLSQTGQNAIVDWVFVELRDKSNPQTVIATRSALLKANGTVVDTDGNSAVSFFPFSPDSYYVAVRHRNHLGVMTNSPIPLTN